EAEICPLGEPVVFERHFSQMLLYRCCRGIACQLADACRVTPIVIGRQWRSRVRVLHLDTDANLSILRVQGACAGLCADGGGLLSPPASAVRTVSHTHGATSSRGMYRRAASASSVPVALS